MRTVGLLGGLDQDRVMVYFKALNERVLEATDMSRSLKATMVTWDKKIFNHHLKDRQKVRLLQELIYQCNQIKQMGGQVLAFTDPQINRYIHEIHKHIPVTLICKEEVLGKAMVKHHVHKVLLISDFDTCVDPYYHQAFSRYGVKLIIPPLKRVNQLRLDQKKIDKGSLSIDDFQMSLVGLIEAYALEGIRGVILEGDFFESAIDADLLSVHVFKSTQLHIDAIYEALISKV